MERKEAGRWGAAESPAVTRSALAWKALSSLQTPFPRDPPPTTHLGLAEGSWVGSSPDPSWDDPVGRSSLSGPLGATGCFLLSLSVASASPV